MKTLTTSQQLLREFIHQTDALNEPQTFIQIANLLTDEGMTNEEIDKMLCDFENEKETGLYLYPPPVLTNSHPRDKLDEEQVSTLLGEFIDVTIDIQILKDKMSSIRMETDKSDEKADELWQQTYVALDKKSELERRVVFMGIFSPDELNELEQEMIDKYYEQQAERV
tara:strand:+ start:184 stop:687 length:504 start_codon:yes stop_codon:yes gene_type:complete